MTDKDRIDKLEQENERLEAAVIMLGGGKKKEIIQAIEWLEITKRMEKESLNTQSIWGGDFDWSTAAGMQKATTKGMGGSKIG